MIVSSFNKARAERGLKAARPIAANRVPKEIWCVIDEEGMPHFSAGWEGACHDHINDALAEGIDSAAQWVVRKYSLA